MNYYKIAKKYIEYLNDPPPTGPFTLYAQITPEEMAHFFKFIDKIFHSSEWVLEDIKYYIEKIDYIKGKINEI